MAKISGFCMSTLLIVLCLWINVCHYPDATVALERRAETLVVPCDAESSEPASAPAPSPAEVKSKALESDEEDAEDDPLSDATLAELIATPKALDVSASRSDVRPTPEPASALPELKPASFPAEIDDAPTTEPQSAAKSLRSLEASNVAAPSSSVANSATKPRGAKYVRVPEVEIDGFVGAVRTTGVKSLGGARVVGATRAEQTLRVPTDAR